MAPNNPGVVHILYTDIDEENEISELDVFGDEASSPYAGGNIPKNCYTLHHDPMLPLRLIHIQQTFPLSIYDPETPVIFQFENNRVPGLESTSTILSNPGSAVPRSGPNGSVLMKIRRAGVIRAYTEREILDEMSREVGPEYFWFMEGGSFLGGSSVGSGREAVNRGVEVATKEVKKALKSVKSSLSDVGIDTKNVEKGARRFTKGLNALWKGAKNAVNELDLETVKDGIAGVGEGVRKGLQGLQMSETVVVGDYDVGVVKLIAEGGFSTVFEVRVEGSGGKFALKKILAQTKEAEKDAKMEVRLLQMMSHKNIINLVASASYAKSIGDRQFVEYLLLFPYVENTAYDIIARNIKKSDNYDFSNISSYGSPMVEAEAINVVLGMCEGLSHMHNKLSVAHRDVKPHNVLLRFDGRGFGGGPTPLLMDVGSVMPLRADVKNKSERVDLEEECQKKCSGAYRCPELTSVEIGGEIGPGCDMWR